MWTGKILTFDLYLVTCFSVKFYTRTHLDELIWKSHGNKTKKQKKPMRGWGRARAQRGGGRWRMLFQCAYSAWAIGIILDQRRWQPASEWCVVFCTLSPGNLWKVCIEISVGRTTTTPLGYENFTVENLSSFLLLFWHPVCSFLFCVPEVLGQRCYCGKLFSYGCSSKEGMNGNLVLNCWLDMWRRRGRKEEYFFDHPSSLEIKWVLGVQAWCNLFVSS